MKRPVNHSSPSKKQKKQARNERWRMQMRIRGTVYCRGQIPQHLGSQRTLLQYKQLEMY